MTCTIVVPTYNERANIGFLIDSLERLFPRIPHRMSILVVDDESPDGTAAVVRHKARRYGNVHLLTGSKRGLGVAYIRGMRYALDKLGADIVMEMDADLSHDPADVPRLLAAIDAGADFVIGSRYVPGGKIPDDWTPWRRLNSKVGNLAARHVAGLSGVRDCTAGFRAIRASLLHRVGLEKLRVQGYAFQVALLHAALAQGARTCEIPVSFVDRTRGETKLGLADIREFILNCWWIRYQDSRTLARFLLVGASGVVVNLLLFTFLVRIGWGKFIASPVAVEASIATNFLLNDRWTFGERLRTSPRWRRALQFNAVSLAALLVSYGTFVAVTLLRPGVPAQLAQLAGIVPALFVNYFVNSRWTFRGARGTPAGARAVPAATHPTVAWADRQRAGSSGAVRRSAAAGDRRRP